MATEKKQEDVNAAERWISYRPEIKIHDCTVRDGGLMNSHKFDDGIVKAVYKGCVDSGIDYMEIGYKADKKIFSTDENGPWKFSDEEDIRRIVGDNDTGLKLSAMADAERTDFHKDILPKSESVLDMIRVATYIHQIPVALDMVQDAHEKGYETSLNLMAVTTVQERELDEALEYIAETDVDVLYIVDSYGSLYSEQTHYLTEKYLSYMEPRGKSVGMHAHNNQQLAYANTIEAIIKGANRVDASMGGLGRGAGNCPVELLIGFLHNPKYMLRPALQCIQECIEPMREKLLWGYDIPYMLTGLLNQHPREAIKFNSSKDRGNIVKFFDSIIEEE